MFKIGTFILNLFKKNKKLEASQDKYSVILEKIMNSNVIKDFEVEAAKKIKIKDIGKEYGKKLKEEKFIYNYPLRTALTREQVMELTQKFFEYIDHDMANMITESLKGKNLKIVIKTPYYDKTHEAFAGNPSDKIMPVVVPIRGDLRDLYGLVHELTHTLDIKNGDNTTRKILGEVAPQCMERMLDEYLVILPQEELDKYGIDKNILLKDIYDRKVTTFLSRVDNAIGFNNKSVNDKKIELRYVLAQIYQSKFMKYSRNERRNKIIEFIRSVERDDFDKANNTFGIDLENSFQRRIYIYNSIQEIEEIINLQKKEGDVPIIEAESNKKREERE